ncbi:MAG: DNA-binding protein WhiA [Actinomycetaceae bacterium]|nr:DNA-binding protein WhiA [Arcanobacterium sp.]MDD7505771.1 DNA-binding protein WhiA [Actinomycetaceae bacterium]MDY6143630.1 DNA-binding protein WhiA [Arcanobacterium sp.]
MRSLTAFVKDEISSVYPASASSLVAEAATMIRFSGGIQVNAGIVSLHSELGHPAAAHHLAEILRRLFHIEVALTPVKSTVRSSNHYLVEVNTDGEKIARLLGLLDPKGRPVRGLPPQIVGGSKVDAGSAWRGAFLARGSLLEPSRNIALEVVCPSLEAAYAIGGLARRLNAPYRARESRGAFRVDIREAEGIARLLGTIGAKESLVQWQNMRRESELFGASNRLANFDDANMRRSADAAVVAVIRVQRAFEILGNEVPANLREAGEFRVKYPDDSLNALGERLTPPATKDAVAGRLRRLNTMADKKAAELGIPNTMDAVRTHQR